MNHFAQPDESAAARLRAHVQTLAATIGERNMWRPEALARAAEYIRMTLAASGYIPAVQRFTVRGRTVENIEAILRGTSAGSEAVVVGAHYDSVIGSPGANDNATGVAAVLDLARRLAGKPRRRTIRFAAFVNEEPPFFQTEEMGSVVYARAARARGDRIAAMLCLETMGYYSDERGSQAYPGELRDLYPDVGNFIGIVADLRSAQLLESVRRSFAAGTDFPVEASAAPAHLPGVGWSDHWSFWEEGYPAVMFTDTAPFRYPWYHTADDTIDKIQFDRLARVVDGVERAVDDLAAAGA